MKNYASWISALCNSVWRRLLACTRLVGLPPRESNVNRRMNNLMMHRLYLIISFLFLIPSSLCIFHNSLHLPSSSLLFQFQLMSFILLRFFFAGISTMNSLINKTPIIWINSMDTFSKLCFNFQPSKSHHFHHSTINKSWIPSLHKNPYCNPTIYTV
jgi:hypothetical protein